MRQPVTAHKQRLARIVAFAMRRSSGIEQFCGHMAPPLITNISSYCLDQYLDSNGNAVSGFVLIPRLFRIFTFVSTPSSWTSGTFTLDSNAQLAADNQAQHAPQNRTLGRSLRAPRRRHPPCLCQWSHGTPEAKHSDESLTAPWLWPRNVLFQGDARSSGLQAGRSGVLMTAVESCTS